MHYVICFYHIYISAILVPLALILLINLRLGLSPGDEENTDDTALANDFYYERATSLFNPSLTEGVPHDFLSL